MTRAHPDLPWCRYADDGLVHCRSELEAETLKVELQARLAECGLEMHPTKSKIVYCKDGKRRGQYPNVTFDFLGYQFRPRVVRSSRNHELFCSFHPRGQPRGASSHTIDGPGLEHPATDPALAGRHHQETQSRSYEGWIGCYGRYNPSALETMLRHVNLTLVGWTMRKFKRFHGRKVGAARFLEKDGSDHTPSSSNTGVSA